MRYIHASLSALPHYITLWATSSRLATNTFNIKYFFLIFDLLSTSCLPIRQRGFSLIKRCKAKRKKSQSKFTIQTVVLVLNFSQSFVSALHSLGTLSWVLCGFSCYPSLNAGKRAIQSSLRWFHIQIRPVGWSLGCVVTTPDTWS